MSIERIGANDARAARRARRWTGLGSTAGLLAFGIVLTSGSPAFAQRVTVTIGGYGAPAGTPANSAANQGAAQNAAANPAGYAQAAWAGAAAYARYMQYLNVMNYQATHGGAMPPGFDVHEYFTNGAEALTIPTAGPGSAYFANGSETTVAPTSSIPSYGPSYGPSGQPPPPPSSPPPTVGSPPAGQSPWVVVVQNPNATATPPAPPPAPASSASALPPSPPPTNPAASPAAIPAVPPPSEPPPDTRQPVVAMSFDDWLQSMGYTAPGAQPEAPPPELTSAVVETGEPTDAPVIAEPAALAYDVRPRVSSVGREKARVHVLAPPSGWGTAGGIATAFAAGLLLGGFGMLRMRDRMRREVIADASVPR